MMQPSNRIGVCTIAAPILCAAALAAAAVLLALPARRRAGHPHHRPMSTTSTASTDPAGRGGVARLAAVVREVRAGSAGRVLVTNGGDAISPSLLSSFDRGAHMIDLFNRVGFDAMVLGNHEFDFTPAVTVKRIAEARFPMLSSNAIEPDGTLIDGVTEHLLLEVGRYKVGVFGLTTVTTAHKSSPAPVTFRPVVEAAGGAGGEAARGQGGPCDRPCPHRPRRGRGADAPGRGRPAALGR